MKKFSREDFDYRVDRAKKEIEEDIKSGLLPQTVKSFEDLHDYVDANWYGGLIDEDYGHSKNFGFENWVQNTVNEWLQTR